MYATTITRPLSFAISVSSRASLALMAIDPLDVIFCKKIAEEILIEKFNQTKKVKIVGWPAICKLVVVLEPTIESNLNKNGVVISVAHASTFDFFILYAMAQKFEKSTESQLQRKIEELYQNGATTLEYINVAHVDVPSRDKLNKVFSVVVQRFIEKQVLIYEEAFK